MGHMDKKSVVLYCHVHQPFRIRKYDLFSIGGDNDYFDTQEARLDNKRIMDKVADKCYLPANALILDLLNEHEEFKISYSISGVILEQFAAYAPEVLKSFQRLVDTGRVEILAETYYHSLASVASIGEFIRQVNLHREAIEHYFGVTPTAFRNTELIYYNDLAKTVADMGFKTILAEGVDRILGWRSPNFVYQPHGESRLKLLLKNYRLSDDIAFRFSNREWSEWPMSADTYADWLKSALSDGDVVNLFMDYETFGEHQWEDTGIFDFLATLTSIIEHDDGISFATVTEAAHSFPVRAEVDIPEVTSWADTDRDLSAWLSNPMQHQALDTLFSMEREIMASNDVRLIGDWRKLTTSDHFYYMCTKWWADGDVHTYFSPYTDPYEAFVTYMTVLHDVRDRLYSITSSS